MGITAEQLRRIFLNCPNPEVWAPAISAAWQRFDFMTLGAWAGYLGIVGNETGGLIQVTREDMDYSPSRAREVFGSWRANRCVQYCTLDDDGRLVRNDKGEAFANCIYANMLGNGDFASGDGWRTRGLGIIQMTGADTQDKAADDLGLPRKGFADRVVSDPMVSAATAAWFMAVRRPQILPLLDTGSEVDFRAGAALVGHSVDNDRTRLRYWRAALAELGGGAKPTRRLLKKGCIGDDVRELQRALNRTLVLPLAVDGSFGERTYKAVRFFQAQHGLSVDGVVGAETRKALGLEA